MRTLQLAALAAALPLAAITAPVAAPAAVGTAVFEGNIVHISTDNIKVANPKETLSFLLVPHFDQVFSSDGKTTYQMKKLHTGQLVKVYYDQKALGARHADRIIVLTRGEQPAKQLKS
jgi:hypothetical protein